MSAPIVEIEGETIRVYRWADLNLSLIQRICRKPNRQKLIIGLFVMTNSPEFTMTREINAPSTITISAISARSPM